MAVYYSVAVVTCCVENPYAMCRKILESDLLLQAQPIAATLNILWGEKNSEIILSLASLSLSLLSLSLSLSSLSTQYERFLWYCPI